MDKSTIRLKHVNVSIRLKEVQTLMTSSAPKLTGLTNYND